MFQISRETRGRESNQRGIEELVDETLRFHAPRHGLVRVVHNVLQGVAESDRPHSRTNFHVDEPFRNFLSLGIDLGVEVAGVEGFGAGDGVGFFHSSFSYQLEGFQIVKDEVDFFRRERGNVDGFRRGRELFSFLPFFLCFSSITRGEEDSTTIFGQIRIFLFHNCFSLFRLLLFSKSI